MIDANAFPEWQEWAGKGASATHQDRPLARLTRFRRFCSQHGKNGLS